MILGDFIFVVFHLKIHQAVSCKYFETSDFIIVKKKNLLKDFFFLCSNSFYIFLLKKIKCLAVERLDVQIEQSRILTRYDNISCNNNVITICLWHIENPVKYLLWWNILRGVWGKNALILTKRPWLCPSLVNFSIQNAVLRASMVKIS